MHWINQEKINLVWNVFESTRDIWTQRDIEEITGLNHPAVSEVMIYLEQAGEIYGKSNEGAGKTKFYCKFSDKCPVLDKGILRKIKKMRLVRRSTRLIAIQSYNHWLLQQNNESFNGIIKNV